jgi:hypothetical protein
MKKKSLLFKFVVLLVVCGAVVALLEALNLHPEFSCGRFHSIWAGVRHMDFESGTRSVPAGGGKKKIIQRDYDLGPVKIAIDS